MQEDKKINKSDLERKKWNCHVMITYIKNSKIIHSRLLELGKEFSEDDGWVWVIKAKCISVYQQQIKKRMQIFKCKGINLTKIANISVYKIILLKLILKDVNTRWDILWSLKDSIC